LPSILELTCCSRHHLHSRRTTANAFRSRLAEWIIAACNFPSVGLVRVVSTGRGEQSLPLALSANRPVQTGRVESDGPHAQRRSRLHYPSARHARSNLAPQHTCTYRSQGRYPFGIARSSEAACFIITLSRSVCSLMYVKKARGRSRGRCPPTRTRHDTLCIWTGIRGTACHRTPARGSRPRSYLSEAVAGVA